MKEPAAGPVTVGSRGSEGGVTLIELLIVLIIMSIVSTMLIATWVTLSNSYAFTTRSSHARDFARQAASHIERELRDAEAQVAVGLHYQGLPPVLWASANKIEFVTTFNNAGNDNPSAKPLAVQYYLQGGALYMRRDANDDGLWDAQPRNVVPNVVNSSVGTPIFSYTYIDVDGNFVTAHPVSDAAGLSLADRARIISISFTLLVDINPGHAPTYINLTTTAQLRNQRRF